MNGSTDALTHAPETDGAPVGLGGVDEKPKKSKKRDSGESGKKAKKPKPKKVYEAGAIILCDGKVVLRLTDEQHWIFPKGKLKKHESPADAALREAEEETGLTVELIGEAGEFSMHVEGKKRRFVFYLAKATGRGWDWDHHNGRDTFLLDVDRVGSLVHRHGYADLWSECHQHVVSLIEMDEPITGPRD
ncbi:MAG: NUDIX domain-containing protein [Chloroflexota bacterium]